MTHSFAVCAYGDSPYLEACLRSLVRQSVPSERLLCTATPSAFLKDLAKKYGFRYCVREGKPGIGADWNFALSQAEGSFVTLAHQDDVYGAHYTEELLRAVKRYPNLALFTSDARILKNGVIQRRSKAECVKKLLRFACLFSKARRRASASACASEIPLSVRVVRIAETCSAFRRFRLRSALCWTGICSIALRRSRGAGLSRSAPCCSTAFTAAPRLRR